MERLVTHMPGAGGQQHERFDAGDFIQDALGPTLAGEVNALIQTQARM